MAITLSAFCLAILIVSMLGGLLPLATIVTHTRLQMYLSFSAGTMLGAAFFHMMPEAVRVGSIATIPWVSFGLLALFFLERFFSFHQHEPHPHEPHTHDPVASSDAHGMTHTPHDPTTICTRLDRSPRRGDIAGRKRFAMGIGRFWFDDPFARRRCRASERRRRRL